MVTRRVPAGGDDAAQTQTQRLPEPHERDESTSDETTPDRDVNRKLAKKGADDVNRGAKDTSLGPQLDRTYQKVAED